MHDDHSFLQCKWLIYNGFRFYAENIYIYIYIYSSVSMQGYISLYMHRCMPNIQAIYIYWALQQYFWPIYMFTALVYIFACFYCAVYMQIYLNIYKYMLYFSSIGHQINRVFWTHSLYLEQMIFYVNCMVLTSFHTQT